MASAETAVAVEMRAAAAACHGVTAVTINNTITDGFSQHDMWFAVPFLTGNRAAYRTCLGPPAGGVSSVSQRRNQGGGEAAACELGSFPCCCCSMI